MNLAVDDADLLAAPTLIGREVGEESKLFFTKPTPRAANQAGYLGFVGDTHFSNDRGFYRQPLWVDVTTDTPDAEIYYTIDGGEPTPENGILFTDPLSIDTTTVVRAAAYKPGLLPSNIDTQTHLYINGIYWGLYNVGERPAGPHQAAYFGGEKTDYDVINSNESIDGDLVAWNEMMAIVNAGVASDQAYANLRQSSSFENRITFPPCSSRQGYRERSSCC